MTVRENKKEGDMIELSEWIRIILGVIGFALMVGFGVKAILTWIDPYAGK